MIDKANADEIWSTADAEPKHAERTYEGNFRRNPAAVIGSDAEAIAAARDVAAAVAAGAAERDRERRLPFAEVDLFSSSGLWAINIPRDWGGADVRQATLGEVHKIMATADPSIAQLPKNHFHAIDILRLAGTEEQKRYFFGEVLSGMRIGHAASERGTKTAFDIKTRLVADGRKLFITGQKFYTTGSLFADWIAATAIDDADRFVQVFVRRDSPGLTVVDDWTGFGQRTTASGTLTLDRVAVDPGHVLPLQDVFENPTLAGPISQFLHACIDAGVARAAIDDAIDFVNTKTRPWPDSGLKNASDDPHTIFAVGDLMTRLFAAEAALDQVGRRLDETPQPPSEEDVAERSIDVSVAKILTTELVILATNKLFELAGARSTLAEYNLDRHWRNARTHTLHDPVRWKYHAIGNYYLNRIPPRRHNYI